MGASEENRKGPAPMNCRDAAPSLPAESALAKRFRGTTTLRYGVTSPKTSKGRGGSGLCSDE